MSLSYQTDIVKENLASKSYDTAKEIAQQPEMWRKTYEIVKRDSKEIGAFLNSAFRDQEIEVILTGAGSSAYIGDAIYPAFSANIRSTCMAIPTTDILSHPLSYLPQEKPLLLVSFARSGNSPESIAVYNLANKVCATVYHIVITCNIDGKLYKTPQQDNVLKILLPEKANDKSLAMTSSFSSMMLAGLLISKIDTIDKEQEAVHNIADSAQNILNNYSDAIKDIAGMPFERAVFLGSGPLRGTAREGQLKLQELTNGKVICKCDSFLGFRHGPKAVIDDTTLIVYLFSDDEYVRAYETDLVNQMDSTSRGLYQVAVFNKHLNIDNKPGLMISMSESKREIPEEYLCILHVVVPQILGFYKSVQMGLSPDSPSPAGAISRVVKGVSIYPFEK